MDDVRQQRKYRDAVRALTSLEAAGFPARLAGGCVRDRLLGLVPADYDVATAATPDEVMRHFKQVGLKTVPTGVDHGTVTLVTPSGPVEITTLRTDVATDGRHATVAFGTSFEADAARRDFTVNAMFEDAAGTVYDYFGGRADLEARVLRFVGDAATRIREDYLRILRFFRFWARFDLKPDSGTLVAVSAEKGGLAGISQERITGELLRMFAGGALRPALLAMADTGVFAAVLPEVSAAPQPSSATLAAWQRAAADVRGLAVLGGLVLAAGLTRAAAEALGVRLRLSAADSRRLAFFPVLRQQLAAGLFAEPADALELVDAAEGAGGGGAFAALYEPVLTADGAVLKALLHVQATEAKLGHRRTAKLPLDGTAVAAALAIPPGPAVGEALTRLRRAYRNGLWHSPAEGLAYLKNSRTDPS